MKKVGLIINPIAGMGGKVGLKGTDSFEILKKAIDLGAHPQANSRSFTALEPLLSIRDKIIIVTFPGDMGETLSVTMGFSTEVLLKDEIALHLTSRSDTKKAAKELLKENVDLLLFAGGDGTARDIYESVGTEVPVLGIPAGVKIHSAVFGCSPKESGEVALLFLGDGKVQEKISEVMDIDEELFRRGELQASLFGYLRVPYIKQRVQGLKAGSAVSEENVQRSIAAYVTKEIFQSDVLYFIGPGTTTRAVLKEMNLKNTLLGIDCLFNKKILSNDIAETRMIKFCKEYPKKKLVITPIGGQGFLFGRGNQQISSKVLEYFTLDDILVLCTPGKLNSLDGAPFFVDTGDELIDSKFSGYIRVITGYSQYSMYKINQ